jgi:hypothetical protein
VQALLLGGLDDTFFQYEPCKAAYQRLHNVAKKRSVILGYTELLEDPALNEEYRDLLRESEVPACRTVDRAHRLIEALDKYRKTRALYYMAKDIIDELKKPEVEVDDLLDEVTNVLTTTRSRHELGNLVHSIGRDANAIDLVDDALSMEDEALLKCGFKDIDEKNGGVPSEGVMLLAATTSGGKSTLLMNMLTNMYRINKISVANVSLEMNERKITRRLLSSLTKIPYWKFVKKALSDEERAEAKRAWRKLHRYGEKYDAQYSFICPKRGVNITQLLTLVKPYGYKVIGIDYISLLDGIDEKDQWKALSAVVRQCKLFSGENNCLVILLAQLDSDDDRIRYSKGMLEHADAAWTWNYYKPEQRESKVLPIRQLKARDQELFPFELKELFEVMSVENMDGEEAVDGSSKEGGEVNVSNGSKRTSSRSKGEHDLNLNDDEVEVDYEAGQK